MIRLLVVEDTPAVLETLLAILNSEPTIQVIGVAHDGKEAVEAVNRDKPDLITMDIHLPKMDGFEATRKIMETNPLPIIIVSDSENTDDVTITFQAMEAGALIVLPKPMSVGHLEHEVSATRFIQTIKTMAEVKVVRRWPKVQPKILPSSLPLELADKPTTNTQIVVMGASTGGPVILQSILSALPANFPVPIIIIQHMTVGFIRGLVEWLAQSCFLPIHLAAQGEFVLPGHVYVAPDDAQIKIGMGGRIILTKDPGENGHCPSISYCFKSVAEVYGKQAIGVLLSGMGRDGAKELKLMRDNGAITIAQDEESCVIFGMPGEAVKLGGAQYILKPEKITDLLKELLCSQNKQ